MRDRRAVTARAFAAFRPISSLSYLFLPRDGKIALCNITVNGSMENGRFQFRRSERLVERTPLIPRESSVSKETGRQGAAKRYRCDSSNSKVVRTHRLHPTDGIDRSIHGGTFQLSVGSKGNKGTILDIGDGIAYYFLPRFLFFCAWREGWGVVHAVRSKAIAEKRGGIESETRGDVSRGEISPYAIKASASTRTAAYVNRCVAR